MSHRDDSRSRDSEQTPLLGANGHARGDDDRELLELGEDDSDNPRAWPGRRKYSNVAVIAAMSLVCPLASDMFTPGIDEMAKDLHSSTSVVIGATSGFVVMLGVGPLVLAPMSETFGRRNVYLASFTAFTLLQVLTALSPNIAWLLVWRAVAGFFGSISIANGGGTISDMFHANERAGVFGWYLLGPLLGPTLGPMLGGIIVMRLGWRWIFWVLSITCVTTTLAGFLFLQETYAPVILAWRKRDYEKGDSSRRYRFEGEDDRPLRSKLATSLRRPLRILSHPIVLTMSLYQALLFSTTFSLYTNMEPIFHSVYGFNTEQVGLCYLGFGAGFLSAVWFLVPRIDAIYNALARRRNGGEGKPEYRLPLANVGALLVPVSLFWFAWSVQLRAHWAASVVATVPFGVGMVLVMNTVQNYYIDAFEKYAASAIAAGALFRSLVGGTVPLFGPALFAKLGYGWGISVFGFVAVALAPAPIVFFYFGERVRRRFHVDL